MLGIVSSYVLFSDIRLQNVVTWNPVRGHSRLSKMDTIR